MLYSASLPINLPTPSTQTIIQPLQTSQVISPLLPQSQPKSTHQLLTPNSTSSKVNQTLQHMHHRLETQIQSGILTINLHSTPLSAFCITQTDELKSKNFTPFYTSSNPSLIKLKYTQFLQLRKHYSHPKNQTTINQMEQLIKSWINRQKTAESKRNQINQKIEQQKLLEMQREEEDRRRSLEAKLEQYKINLVDKIEFRKLRKQQQDKLMKADSISKQMLKQKQPLYKQKQQQFIQKQQVEREAKAMELYWKKQSLSPYDFQNLKEHRVKLAKQLKRQSQQLLQTSGSPDRLKTESIIHFSNTRSEFITTKNDRLIIKGQEQRKRLRIKQYVERLKSMSPDRTTLQRINKVKEEIVSTEKLLHQNILRRMQKTQNAAKKRALSMKSLASLDKGISQKEKNQMGNKYRKQHGKNIKINQQNRNNDTIEENPEESSSRDLSKAKQICKTQIKHPKLKTENKEQDLQTNPRPSPTISLRKQYHSRSLKTLPDNPKSLHQTRPQYKNYLPQMKNKLANPQSEIQKAKRALKYPQQIFLEFGKQSLELEKKLMKKIKEFKRIQSNEKYEKNLVREGQIDELYHKNLQIKLACLEME